MQTLNQPILGGKFRHFNNCLEEKNSCAYLCSNIISSERHWNYHITTILMCEMTRRRLQAILFFVLKDLPSKNFTLGRYLWWSLCLGNNILRSANDYFTAKQAELRNWKSVKVVYPTKRGQECCEEINFMILPGSENRTQRQSSK